MLKFNYQKAEKQLTCYFAGRLDTIASFNLSDELYAKLNTLRGTDDPTVMLTDKINFDMTEVNYIASSFIRICVTVAKQVPRGNLTIVNCDPFLKKTFKIAGLDEIMIVT
jgi:anti-anti-sigma factor